MNTVKQTRAKSITSEKLGYVLQRTGSRRAIKTPFPSHKKKPPAKYQFSYDNTFKGWREKSRDPVVSRWGKARGVLRAGSYFQKIGNQKKSETVLNIDVKSLVNATLRKKMQELKGNRKETEDPEEESLETTLKEPSSIPKPFVRTWDTVYDGVWVCPAKEAPCVERNKHFTWEKPKVERRQLRESAASYQVIYLEKMLKEKEKEMKLITNQLLKSNKENVSLIKELEGYRGKNYDELLKENIHLKDQMARISRDNNVLTGQVMQNSNRTLLKWRTLRRERSAI